MLSDTLIIVAVAGPTMPVHVSCFVSVAVRCQVICAAGTCVTPYTAVLLLGFDSLSEHISLGVAVQHS